MSNYEFWDELGRIFNAVVAYQEKTIEFNDRFITPWIRLGNVFDKQDRNKEAASAYQKAIAIDPSNAKNWYELGNIYFQMNDFENAADAYRKSTELSPDSGWAYNNLALTLVSQGKYEDSIPLYQKGVALLPDDKDKAVAWNRLGNVYRKLNNYDQAVIAFHEADKLDAENAGFRDVLDDVTDGPSLVEAVSVEGQSGNEVVEPIQSILENTQDLDAASKVMSVDSESTTETLGVEDQVVSDESAVVEADLASELTTDVISQTPTDPTPVELQESELEFESVDEIPEAVSEAASDTDAAQDLDVKVPATALELINEGEQFVSDEIESEEVAQTEAVDASVESKTTEPRSILQIVEDVIAKVLAESVPETLVETEAETEGVSEQAVSTSETTADFAVENPDLPVQDQNVNDQVSPPELDLVNDDQQALSELEADDAALFVETTAPEVKNDSQPEAGQMDDPSRVTGELGLDIDHDQALSLIAQNTGETFTDTLFVANTETDTSDASLLITETNDDLNNEAQVEEASAKLSLTEQDAAADTQTGTANVAYEEYLKDNNGHFKILVNESVKESETAQDTLLPAELIAKIDSSGELQIEVDEKNAHVWNELGNVYFNTGAYEDAVIAYSKSIELDRQFAWPYSNLALVYVQKGRFAEAMLLYQRSIELFSNDNDKAISWNRLGNVYRRLNDYDNAIAAYQRADELDTDNTTLSLQSRFSLLGNYYMEKKPSFAS